MVYKSYILGLLGIITLLSCSDKSREPSNVYMPDMYYPTAYDPYQEAVVAYQEYTGKEKNDVPVFKKNSYITALVPVQGSVPRNKQGLLPYDLPDNLDGYNASKTLDNPLNEDKDNMIERGKKMYLQNCTVCHGNAGNGQGSIVKSGAYSGVPNYKEREITVGSVHHVIMYGKNAMGSYASQLESADRWRVAEYVIQLRNTD